MPTNDFIGFASSGSANIMTQAAFAAAAEQTSGVQPGPASSKLANKVWRQGANMAAAIGQIIAGQNGNALDNGDINSLQSALEAALINLDVVSATTAYYQLKNGLQILTGSGVSSSSGAVTVNFDHAFAATPRVMAIAHSSSTTCFTVKADNVLTTAFDFVCVNASNAYVNGASIRYLAFGIGA